MYAAVAATIAELPLRFRVRLLGRRAGLDELADAEIQVKRHFVADVAFDFGVSA